MKRIEILKKARLLTLGLVTNVLWIRVVITIRWVDKLISLNQSSAGTAGFQSKLDKLPLPSDRDANRLYSLLQTCFAASIKDNTVSACKNFFSITDN